MSQARLPNSDAKIRQQACGLRIFPRLFFKFLINRQLPVSVAVVAVVAVIFRIDLMSNVKMSKCQMSNVIFDFQTPNRGTFFFLYAAKATRGRCLSNTTL